MIVTLEGISKRFAVPRAWREMLRSPLSAPRATAVDDVSFGVSEGEIFGLLGQNGAGKTTLFKVLSTLLLPDMGRARVGGHDVTAAPEAARRLLAPVIANERTLYWRLSARENLRLYAVLQGLRGDAVESEVARTLAVSGLEETGRKMVGQFSSGMRQRLLIARALLAHPRILLLDEPTRSLDPLSARAFRTFLRDSVVRGEGCTVLLATHDADDVWDLCDRVAVLERGRVLAVDATSTLRHRAGTARFRVWIRVADAPAALHAAAAAGYALTRRGAAADAGWDEHECEVRGGTEEAARVLAILAADGRAVARFEPVAPSLADLIERVLATARGRVDA